MNRTTIIISILSLLIVISCNGNAVALDRSSTFIGKLPLSVKKEILWYCDYEDNSFKKWIDAGTEDDDSGGGIFLTDEDNVEWGIENQNANSGHYSSYASIHNASTPGENKAVRFMRWTDKAWNNDGRYFPEQAYYSVFIFLPETYDPSKPPENDPNSDGGWWNIFQFKSDNNAGSMPVVVLDLYNQNNQMFFGLVIKDYPDDDSESHTQAYFVQSNPQRINPMTWVHIEMFLKKSEQYDGEVFLWQDGVEIFHKQNIRTVLPPGETATWGIGNYTDYINSEKRQGTATVYFDDAIVSSVKISDYLDD